jgi:microcystin-dependent protein
MSSPFIAEIKIFAGNFAPRGWAFCNGQLLPIAQNTALFSLIGTTFGGDGRTTTALPNLQGRAPMHPGRGPGLMSRRLGEKGGFENVTLTEAQMANHNHAMNVTQVPGDNDDPGSAAYIGQGTGQLLYAPMGNMAAMANEALPSMGGSGSHTNIQPFLTLNFIIALIGLYPSRS